MTRYEKSIETHNLARRYISGGVSSNFRYHTIPVPLCFVRGKDAYLWDTDGNRYIDFVLGNGPAILGHTPKPVLDAVRDTLDKGQAFTSVHPEELALAKRLTEIIPCAEEVRFDVSGTQANQIALRLARAHSKKDTIIKFEGQYHGWADNILVSVGPSLNEAGPYNTPTTVAHSRGQPKNVVENVLVQPFNDLAVISQTLSKQSEHIGAILVEPIACNTGVIEPSPGFLEGLRNLCDKYKIVLIFDEVITGFRASLGGAQQRYGVTPDLAVFAKACAAGFPISIVAGKREIMNGVTDGVIHGGTYNGLTSTVAACAATIATLAANNGALYKKMERQGKTLIDGMNTLGRKHNLPLHAQGIGTIFTTVFTQKRPLTHYRDYKSSDEGLRLRFVEELQHRGVRTTSRGTWFMSSVLTDNDIQETLNTVDAALEALQQKSAKG